jgi:hypothetical protein
MVDVTAVEVHVRQVHTALLQVSQHGVRRPEQRTGRRPAIADVPPQARIGYNGVGQLQSLYADRPNLDGYARAFAVVAGDPLIQTLELGQHPISGGTLRGFINSESRAADQDRGQGVTPAPQQRQREVRTVASFEQELTTPARSLPMPKTPSALVKAGTIRKKV